MADTTGGREAAAYYDEDSFRILAEESPNMIFISRDGSMLYVNRKCEQVMGYTRDDICSPNFDYMRLVAPESHELTKLFYQKRMANLEFPPNQYSLLTKSGSRVEVIITARMIKYCGEPAILGIVTDITKQKNTERELRALNKELAESNRKLKLLSLTDSHTGLYNHRFLEEILDAEFARAKREGGHLSLIMLDIDYFKSINDVYGHSFGDIVLKQFAGQLKNVVRRYNSIIRYGGEEFIIVSPEADRNDAVKMSHRILAKVAGHTFGNRKTGIKLKVSLAIASYPEDGIAKPMDLVELADRILGKAKEFGGNRAYSTIDIRELNGHNGREAGAKTGVKYLKEKIDRLSKRANQSLIEAVFAFARTIELKDHYTGEHVERTVLYATKIAEKLGLSKDEIMLIKQAAILHDLGKVGISEKILLKPAKLTKKELKEIKEHPLIGADIIRPIHLLHKIIPLIMYHHERWDGQGYPMGLKDREIPIGARIISLADTYQALISNRPYRKAFSKAEARKMILKGSGSQFDPAIVDLFLKIMVKEK